MGNETEYSMEMNARRWVRKVSVIMMLLIMATAITAIFVVLPRAVQRDLNIRREVLSHSLLSTATEGSKARTNIIENIEANHATQSSPQQLHQTNVNSKEKPVQVESYSENSIKSSDDISFSQDSDLGSLPKGMLDYLAWHKKQVANPSPDTKYLIFTCDAGGGCGGLGDRLRSMLLVFYYAILSNQVFAIKWDHPSPFRELFEPDSLDWMTPLEQCPPGKIINWHLNATEVLEYMAGPDRCKFAKSQVAFLYDELWELGLDKALGLSSSQSNYPLSTWGLRILLKPTMELENEYSNMLAELGMTRGQPYVAVHVRLGNYGVTYKDPLRHRPSELSDFAACAASMQRYLLSRPFAGAPGRIPKEVPIFIASDANMAKENLSAALSSVKYFPEEAFHIDRSLTHPDVKKNLSYHSRRTMAEFLFVARSSCIVASLSGFSMLSIFWSLNTTTQQRCWAWVDLCNTFDTLPGRVASVHDSYLGGSQSDQLWYSRNGLKFVSPRIYIDGHGNRKRA
eukprot:CAMPEP_0184698602 /NCGR_PEP_ID=MMETSP0313-20130426/5165_1 /TAXON_ID=2792 /ORGANISM="Porphyridium aerugineum, Strain SAG 1380-2" /LENGTH=511 /DNA_ID=CAMNT_0027157565 /DNA_START=138 /DNA_END=1673 /DNA_ORIENTATION=+